MEKQRICKCFYGTQQTTPTNCLSYLVRIPLICVLSSGHLAAILDPKNMTRYFLGMPLSPFLLVSHFYKFDAPYFPTSLRFGQKKKSLEIREDYWKEHSTETS